MSQAKTLQLRETELQSLIATATGRVKLQELVSRYEAASGKLKASRSSVVTYIVVHERAAGLISD